MTAAIVVAPPRACVDLVMHFEGLYLSTYLCPAGVPTIGYGHTGPDVRLGMTITAEQADVLLAGDLRAAAASVALLVHVKLTMHELAALTAFTFNVGAGALANSTLLAKLNGGDYSGAHDEFGRWVHGGGRLLPGLVARRAAEAQLFATPDDTAAPDLDGEHHHMPQMLDAPAGAEQDRVRRLQWVVGTAVDGVYGPATRDAVRRWQAAHGLVADGIVGPRTASAMGLDQLATA